MTAPKPPRLLDVEEWLYVAGTHDVHIAVRIAASEHSWFSDADRDLPLEHVPSLAEKLSEMLTTAHTDWMRWIPANHGNCMCGYGHRRDLYPAEAGSPGAFRVVWWN
jgi:hypothetical protein